MSSSTTSGAELGDHPARGDAVGGGADQLHRRPARAAGSPAGAAPGARRRRSAPAAWHQRRSSGSSTVAAKPPPGRGPAGQHARLAIEHLQPAAHIGQADAQGRRRAGCLARCRGPRRRARSPPAARRAASAMISMVTGRVVRATPYFTAFSISGCRIRPGTRASRSSGGAVSVSTQPVAEPLLLDGQVLVLRGRARRPA